MARRGNAPFAAQTNRPGSGVGEAFDNFADGRLSYISSMPKAREASADESETTGF
jgi:hypothetical protein